MEIRVDDSTLNLQEGGFLLTVFLNVFLNQIIIYQEMLKL